MRTWQCLIFFLTIAVCMSAEVRSRRWISSVVRRLHTKLVHKAYYAKCLVDSPLTVIVCRGVSYGAGLTPEAAKDSARYYASATGDYRCGYFVGQCIIRQFEKKTP
ncbi:unnamed protein product [Mesocestoides corti]|uniref:SCP domain-containing protein n=2 Tax=Mesocestoides corti TaxID=53468 RepID=A0A0R3U7M4_MESCO|nr:unnamed protein product [Mesocestoides corti]